MELKEIGKNMKFAREQCGKDVYQVESETKINHSNIYRWENGQVEPKITQLIKLAECYGVSIDELVTNKI